MLGRMHFGKFWNELSLTKILKFVILLCFMFTEFGFTFLIFRGVDHQWDGEHFATVGAQVDIWNHNRWSIYV